MANRIFQTKVKLIKNIEVGPKYYKILLRCPLIAKSAKPGQFIEIKISDNYEPLLRRPFSVHRLEDNNIEILYEIVGRGTEILSTRKAGEYLDVIGPLGNGFSYEQSTMNHGLILIAGGMGVAPLLFLAEKLAECKVHSSRFIVLIGAKIKSQILCEKEFRDLGCEVKIATDDGSKGFKGKVTELLTRTLSTMNYDPSTIYACGPQPMLKEIAAVSKKCNIPAQISLEAHMACGIGACLGCVVNTIDGFKRVCKEGPVFNSEEIMW